jgi:hypothetical protein
LPGNRRHDRDDPRHHHEQIDRQREECGLSYDDIVRRTAEMATPNDAPSDDAIL